MQQKRVTYTSTVARATKNYSKIFYKTGDSVLCCNSHCHMDKDFDSWNKIKKETHETPFRDFIHTREVWWCSLGANIGFEQDGKHDSFERPILVLKKFSKDTVLAIPLTTHTKKSPYHIVFIHQDQEYSAIISQIRLVSTKRLKRKMYKMDTTIFERVREAVRAMV